IVDLLQRTSGLQNILHIVGGVVDDDLGVRATDSQQECGGDCHCPESRPHDTGSTMRAENALEGAPGGMRRSAAQSRPFLRSQASAKAARPCFASTLAIAAWSVFDEAAVKASATSPRPSSKSRFPRRDWQ